MPSLDERVLPQRFEELRDWQNLDAVVVHPTETFVANDELSAQRAAPGVGAGLDGGGAPQRVGDADVEQVELRRRLCARVSLRIVRMEKAGQPAAVDAIREPVSRQLRGDERMQAGHPRTSREQVRTASLQLSGAATGQNEPERPVPLDQQMHFVEQRGTFLDLVHHHDLLLRVQRLPETLNSRNVSASSRS